jgi:hypothetical protein
MNETVEKYASGLIEKYGPTMNRQKIAIFFGFTEATVKLICRQKKWDRLPKPIQGQAGIEFQWKTIDVASFVYSKSD